MLRHTCAMLVTVAALPLFSVRAFSQQQLNEIQLSNGGDGFFALADPSNGFPTGTNPPDVAGGDFVWKVFPKEVLRAADGAGPHQMELNGITVQVFDTDWTTAPSFYDLVFARGTASGLPDNIGPDFTDPNATLVSFGSATALGLTNPCLLPGNPLGCSGPCPVGAGAIVGWTVEFALGGGTGPNGGLLIPADGATDLTVTSFFPGGMTLTAGTGACGSGDYTFGDLHSSNVFGGTPGEFQAPTPSGNSPYGGFAVAGTLFADNIDETQDMPIEFQQPTMEGRTSFDPAPNPTTGTTGLGLSSLRFSVGGGGNGYGTKIVAASHVGEFGFVFGSTFPQLAYPGIQAFGIDFLINLADPSVNTTSSFWNGSIAFVNNGGAPFDDGALTMVTIPIPAVAAGLPLNMQGYTLNFSTFAFDATGTFAASLLP